MYHIKTDHEEACILYSSSASLKELAMRWQERKTSFPELVQFKSEYFLSLPFEGYSDVCKKTNTGMQNLIA